MNEDKQYPIAEIFTSWQGEGLWAGTRMTFIRFAGCNVGKPISGAQGLLNEELVKHTVNGPLPIWQEECTTWDGRKFLCDTDFRVKERLTAIEILSRVPEGVTHLCFTGGEPLLHAQGIDLIRDMWMDKIKWFLRAGKIFHIETSGTILYDYTEHKSNWITVSPKLNCKKEMIQRANEVKFLVDENFDESKAEELAKYDTDFDSIFWLSPINDTYSIDQNNMKKCLEILERHPNWRITNQNHKLWSVR